MPEQQFTVVVGVDGSPNGQAALDWALGEARCRHGRVRMILAWSTPYDWQMEPLFPVDTDAVRNSARHRLDEAVAAAQTAGVDVETDLVEGEAGAVLVEASRHADLLVVGTRGHSRLAHVLLGSVSNFCAHHAGCPVVLIPAPHQSE